MTPQTDSPIRKPRDAAAWAKQATHEVTLPSGAQVEIKVPSLPQLAKAGQIPNELLDVATQQVENPNKVDVETLSKLGDFHRWIIAEMVIRPKVTPEQVADLPYEDVEMLVEFAGRQRDTDAVGHQLGGLETTEEWQGFREDVRSLASLVG